MPSLARYLVDTETTTTHTLQELLFNLPYVHRTYCLTYQGQSELFFPLRDCTYVFDSKTKEAFLSAKLSTHYSTKRFMKRLPPGLVQDPTDEKCSAIRSSARERIKRAIVTSNEDMANLISLNRVIRQDLSYINGVQTLWYAKATVAGPARLNRSPLTMALAAMHRLSEICRYRPLQLDKFLSGQRNWLLSEFVNMAPAQYIDGIASEITGHQFMLPNVRPAS